MTTKIKFNFHPVFRSDGDTLWLGFDPGEEAACVYACSDGTRPYDCEDGPYIIDIDEVRSEGMHIGPSISSGKLYGRFHYVDRHGKRCRVSSSLGCARELAVRLGVTKVVLVADNESSQRGEETIRIVGEFQ